MIRDFTFLFIKIFLVFSISSCNIKFHIDLSHNQEDQFLQDDSHKPKEYDKVNTSWIIHTSGIQCGIQYFQDVTDVMNYLNINGLSPIQVCTVNNYSCSACGCPNNLHYAAQIYNLEIDEAESIGWRLATDNELTRIN